MKTLPNQTTQHVDSIAARQEFMEVLCVTFWSRWGKNKKKKEYTLWCRMDMKNITTPEKST